MRFNTLILATLSGLASADIEQFVSDLQSYAVSIGHDPSVRSLFEGLTSLSPDQISQLRSAEEAVATQAYTGGYWDAAPAAYSAFPSPYNSYFLSVWSVERSFAIKDGVLTGTPAAASGSAAPASASVSASGATPTPTASGGGSTNSAQASSGSGSGGGSMSMTQAPSGNGSASAGSQGSSSASTAGAATPTGHGGIVALGAVAGLVGVVAACL